MEKKRFEHGMEQLAAVDGTGGENVIRSLEGIAPDLGKFIVEFAFGDIYTREGLTLQEREMITITSLLTAGGCEPQLEVHINGALNVGNVDSHDKNQNQQETDIKPLRGQSVWGNACKGLHILSDGIRRCRYEVQ